MSRPMLRALLVSITLAPLAAACAREATPPPGAASPASAPAPSSAADALDRLDARTPVPLLPMMANHQKQNMREHLEAVQEIVVALAAEDFEGVARASARIGFSEQMGQMCTHMGAGAPGFTEQALEFHHTADRISAAARERDRARVLAELGATLRTCTGCHAAWKQRVVDEPTWTRLTSTSPPAHDGHR
jgi:hypothetical protein